ncbi:Signal transduction response regulator [Macleaya cordata]|uniref:histidine kinase n=1 Tax=Macleaya cordata TaxID=56857 RepID=A0A200PZN3_MACCD|nr:Signal transduction response regulator [Macleaya cordata]
MVCEMGDDNLEEMDMECLPSMWPEDLDKEAGRKFNIEKPGMDQDMLEEVTSKEDSSKNDYKVDFKRLLELTNYTDKGSNQLGYLVKNWEYKQANAVRLLHEEIDILSKQRQEVELKKLEIQEEHRFDEGKYSGDKRPISILEEDYDIWEAAPRRRHDVVVQDKRLEIDAEFDTIKYWKQRAAQLEKLLEASIQREQALEEKLQENIKLLEKLSTPVEELSQTLKRADNFLHFVLQNAPVVIGHQDKELRYRFIYNHFPSLGEEDIIGKTDVEIFTGSGVKESQDFKKEVMERGLPAKREITFDTELFGSKTFLIYVEPVFNKAGDTIGVNYMGMEMTDQVIKREKVAKLREEIAVQKAKETELNKTIHITEETMRAKQMLATMSHEIRSPLTGVVSMAEILSNSKLDHEQRQLLDVMMSSGDLVLQLINDILDLSKVESGVMKLEATKFRPREVVKHVLQTAAASLQKELTLQGHVAEDVPVEVIGDVLRIRQILTNLISNAVKFTHEGKVGIDLYVIPEPSKSQRHGEGPDQNGAPDDGNRKEASVDGDMETHRHPHEKTVWIRCDVYDTGIGIPENAIPTLFKKYMQVSADHARKYGGTGLGLAICKQLVELMGGHLTVTSKVQCGSTFTFVLPYKVSPEREPSDEFSDMDDHEVVSISDANTDDKDSGFYCFEPRTLGSLFSSGGSSRMHKLPTNKIGYNNTLNKLNKFSQDSYSFPSNNCISRETASLEDACSVTDAADAFSEPGSSSRQDMEPDNRHAAHRGEPCQNHANVQQQSYTTESPRCKKTCIEADKMNRSSKQDTGQRQEHEKFDRSSQGRSSSSVDIDKSKLKSKILLVEDNNINVMVAKKMMKQLGHTIDVVNNGVEAVRAVQSHRYELVLMDVFMPKMDGLQATRLIRSFEETGSWDAAVEAGIDRPTSGSLQNGLDLTLSRRRLPIIAMTANALSESAEECLASGMDSFVSKPVTAQKLKEILQQYLPQC